jgi:Uma2 family endonuclease
MILTEALWVALDGQRATITPEMPPPALVVEVVSPGKTNEDRDYRYKRSEYAARGIPEYWIVDPQPPKITLLTLVDGLYEETVFYRDQILSSPTLPGLNLSVNQVFQL